MNNNITTLKGNKGEWAEIYIFLKVLNDGRIYTADSNMRKLDNVFLNVIKVIREEIPKQIVEYYTSIEGDRHIYIKINNIDKKSIYKAEFQEYINKLWLLLSDKNNGQIQSEIISRFLDKIYVHKLKAPATKTAEFFGGTQDITMEVMDYRSGITNIVGFSCKSNFSSPATLFNASGDNTNFKYEIIGDILDDSFMEKFNLLYDDKGHVSLKARRQFLKDNNCNLQFISCVGKNATRNLILSGGQEMPQIVAALLQYDYIEREATLKSRALINALEYIIKTDPAKYKELGFKDINSIYERKLSTLLYDMFTGMRLGSIWNGKSSVNGGYIVVVENGDILAYHSCIAEEFKSFLLKSLEFDSPSASRHKYMTIYKENYKYYINLNLQIRFSKVAKY